MSERDPAPPRGSDASVGCTTPILRVANLDASLAYYASALGFSLAWRHGDFAQVARGEAALMLCEGDQGHPGTWVYVGVSDADALDRELRHRGAMIRSGPTNYPWGARELHVRDPDGHVLRFGSDAAPGAACGDWLDGTGRWWSPQPDGSWRQVERG
ncbi:MAG TPA: glyoxalase superfamily protein [Gemmatirosa sp.]|nr:glyoxalase superfamily protein [Gemmatirosa sp.]